MSITNALQTLIDNVNYDDLQFLITQHHQRLHGHESFPPMNGGKAMQVFAKANGLANSHVLKAMMDEAQQARENAPKPQDQIVVIAIQEKDDSSGGSASHSRFIYARDMDQAKEKLCDDIRDRAGALDRPASELLDCSAVHTPDEDLDEDEESDFDLEDEEAVLEYIFEHNGIFDLAQFLEYLDYDLTTVIIDQHYL